MGDVINLAEIRERNMMPDPDCVTEDAQGIPLYCFAIDYWHGESCFTLTLWAYSWEDAEARLKAIRSTGAVVGKIVSVTPL
ncbi:hypothetical protein VE25_05665 [Devosia geojensis]|uniref:Uncharacterized protein n=1 Tax=Devosia geojensis TaxID=443610 RepID=A0A0F5FV18_9HYPH|nr:hypothetical protein [Devosia geojensis]KKB12721.1 hypothetical protein VE25_05665 [Devosia geojensis]